MKKAIAIVLMLLLLCGLAACGEKNPAVSGDNSDWVWVRDDQTHGVLTDTGYYYTEDHLLCYADLAVGDSAVLCTKVGCDHDDETCDAYIKSTSFRQLLYWNDRIYYFDLFEPVLYSRDSVGLNLKKVCTAASKYIKERKSVEFGRFVVAAGYLYYEVEVKDKVVLENGVGATQIVFQSIGRIDLTTGQDEIIYEEAIEDPAEEKVILCAVRKDELLINYWTGMRRDEGNAEYLDGLENAKSLLLHWNINTKEKTTLIEKDLLKLSGVKQISGGKVYYKTYSYSGAEDAGYTYSYDLNTGKTEMVIPLASGHHLGGGYVQCTDGETQKTVIYDMNTKKTLPFELKKTGAIWDVADNGFVISITNEKEMVYYFVPRKALADGLQEADLLPLYSRKMG